MTSSDVAKAGSKKVVLPVAIATAAVVAIAGLATYLPRTQASGTEMSRSDADSLRKRTDAAIQQSTSENSALRSRAVDAMLAVADEATSYRGMEVIAVRNGAISSILSYLRNPVQRDAAGQFDGAEVAIREAVVRGLKQHLMPDQFAASGADNGSPGGAAAMPSATPAERAARARAYCDEGFKAGQGGVWSDYGFDFTNAEMFSADLSGVVFSVAPVFKGAIFHGPANFSGARFGQGPDGNGAEFDGARFDDAANFSDTWFASRGSYFSASFKGVTFAAGGDF